MTKMFRIKPLYLMGFLLIIGFGIYGVTGVKGTLTPYVGIQEAQSSTDRVQVKGNLNKSSLHSDSLGRLIFDLTDFKSKQKFNVVYSGQHPANMAMARDVVAMGSWDPVHHCFQADQMNIKCPDKYEPGVGSAPPTTS